MNVLNVADLERELNRYAARAYSPHGRRWVMTVARNFLLNSLSEKDAAENYKQISLAKTKDLAQRHIPWSDLPEWALKALKNGGQVMWFNPVQVKRRELWKVLEIIVLWINTWKLDDTRLPRIDRISFPTATNAATMWFKDVSENVWSYVTDKPLVVLACANGYTWVKLVSALQFEREGKLMAHCVGLGYFERWKMGNKNDYYSLRDKLNKPHVTMEVGYNSSHPTVRKGSIMQCKGNTNKKPDPWYQPYITQFIQHMDFSISGDSSFIDYQPPAGVAEIA